MSKITPCLWYDYNAEEAANFYITLLPDSRIDNVMRSPADNPSMKEGGVLVVEFTLAGQPYIGLNGGPLFPFTEAVSFQVRTDDQAETDRLWTALTADGGKESECGWLKDRWGLSWQITPARLLELVADPEKDRARRAMEAMMKMKKIDIAEVERAAEGVTEPAG
ncbi:MAG TPA: VOC family protein [Allosphingosinicella sp.]|nr:VOC family protein [Allosphingosinicella sp.]